MTGKKDNRGDDTRLVKQSTNAIRESAATDEFGTLVRRVVMARLEVVDGPGKGAILDVYKGVNSIGRNPLQNVIALDFGDSAVHREHHGFLEYGTDNFLMHDNGKANPVYVNDQLVSGSKPVNKGDTITIGGTKLILQVL